MSDDKASMIEHATLLARASRRAGTEDPAFVVLEPGSTWTGPDGTTYDVVRAEAVGDRPRWWIPVGVRGDQVGLEEPDELHTDAAPGGAGMLLALVRRAHGVRDAAVFSLESARALLASTKELDAPPERWMEWRDAADGLWIELRKACDEVERLRARVSGLEVDLAAIREAIEAHLPEHSGDLVDRIANAGAVIAGARASRDAYQREARAGERKLAEEHSARIEVVQRLERTEATLKRWQARARKAEARVAVLTEERDGLTLRLGAKGRRRVQRGAKQAARSRRSK